MQELIAFIEGAGSNNRQRGFVSSKSPTKSTLLIAGRGGLPHLYENAAGPCLFLWPWQAFADQARDLADQVLPFGHLGPWYRRAGLRARCRLSLLAGWIGHRQIKLILMLMPGIAG